MEMVVSKPAPAHPMVMSKNKSKGNHLNSTANDLDKTVRGEMVILLNARLADALDLRSQVKFAHWNVKGSHFVALHELFDDVAERLDEQIDEIAERAVQLGGIALGTVRLAAGGSVISEIPYDDQDGKELIRQLVDRFGVFGKSIRAAIESAAGVGDATTSDLFTGVSRAVDKDLWFLEAHLG